MPWSIPKNLRPLTMAALAGLAWFLAGPVAPAQQAPSWQLGGNLMGAFPQGEFNREIKGGGGGASIHAAYRLRQSPVLLGLEAGYLVYGREKHSYPIGLIALSARGEVETNNSIVRGDLALRLLPPGGKVRPYLDGVLGFDYLYTRTSVRDYYSESEWAGGVNLDDTTLHYGAGGGVMVQIYDPPKVASLKSTLDSIDLDLRARYTWGGEAQYMKKGSIRQVEGQVVYDPVRSRVDLFTLGLGVTFSVR